MNNALIASFTHQLEKYRGVLPQTMLEPLENLNTQLYYLSNINHKQDFDEIIEWIAANLGLNHNQEIWESNENLVGRQRKSVIRAEFEGHFHYAAAIYPSKEQAAQERKELLQNLDILRPLEQQEGAYLGEYRSAVSSPGQLFINGAMQLINQVIGYLYSRSSIDLCEKIAWRPLNNLDPATDKFRANFFQEVRNIEARLTQRNEYIDIIAKILVDFMKNELAKLQDNFVNDRGNFTEEKFLELQQQVKEGLLGVREQIYSNENFDIISAMPQEYHSLNRVVGNALECLSPILGNIEEIILTGLNELKEKNAPSEEVAAYLLKQGRIPANVIKEQIYVDMVEKVLYTLPAAQKGEFLSTLFDRCGFYEEDFESVDQLLYIYNNGYSYRLDPTNIGIVIRALKSDTIQLRSKIKVTALTNKDWNLLIAENKNYLDEFGQFCFTHMNHFWPEASRYRRGDKKAESWKTHPLLFLLSYRYACNNLLNRECETFLSRIHSNVAQNARREQEALRWGRENPEGREFPFMPLVYLVPIEESSADLIDIVQRLFLNTELFKEEDLGTYQFIPSDLQRVIRNEIILASYPNFLKIDELENRQLHSDFTRYVLNEPALANIHTEVTQSLKNSLIENIAPLQISADVWGAVWNSSTSEEKNVLIQNYCFSSLEADKNILIFGLESATAEVIIEQVGGVSNMQFYCDLLTHLEVDALIEPVKLFEETKRFHRSFKPLGAELFPDPLPPRIAKHIDNFAKLVKDKLWKDNKTSTLIISVSTFLSIWGPCSSEEKGVLLGRLINLISLMEEVSCDKEVKDLLIENLTSENDGPPTPGNISYKLEIKDSLEAIQYLFEIVGPWVKWGMEGLKEAEKNTNLDIQHKPASYNLENQEAVSPSKPSTTIYEVERTISIEKNSSKGSTSSPKREMEFAQEENDLVGKRSR